MVSLHFIIKINHQKCGLATSIAAFGNVPPNSYQPSQLLSTCSNQPSWPRTKPLHLSHLYPHNQLGVATVVLPSFRSSLLFEPHIVFILYCSPSKSPCLPSTQLSPSRMKLSLPRLLDPFVQTNPVRPLLGRYPAYTRRVANSPGLYPALQPVLFTLTKTN